MSYKLKASTVIGTARKYKDYQEKRKIGTRDQMWDLHWCAGNNNYTIWAMLYKDYTGLNYQGQAWCAMFGTDIVALSFIKQYGVSDTEAAKLTRDFYGGDMPFNCQQFVTNHKNDSRLNHTPKVGSSVIFWTGAKYGHWGIVTNVDSKGFTSIEGNTSGGSDKIDPDGGAVVEKWHSNDSRTYFYHPDYEEEYPVANPPLTTYKVSTVVDGGLKVLAATLNIRNYPGAKNNSSKVGTYKYGDIIVPLEKCFVEHSAWYRTDRGWISAAYLEGWVREDDNNCYWWYMHQGYTYTVSDWEKIGDYWYYMEDTGYIRASDWVQWKGNWYYVNMEGHMVTNAYVASTEYDEDLNPLRYYWIDGSGIWYEDKPWYTTEKPDLSRYKIAK